MLEAARALGKAVEKGYRPKRTIVFTNWDAEEDLLGGSTSWAIDHREKLRRDGVVYINLDSAASGPDFDGGATPALADFLKDTTRAVSHPDVAGSLYDAWSARFSSGEPEVESIVGATDYTAFQENVGMSCVDLISNGPYGVYHSQYDNFYWLSHFGDPGFRINTMMSRFVAVLLWRFANVDVLPMRYSSYATEVLGLVDEIEKKAASHRELRLDVAKAAAEKWLATAREFERQLDGRMESDEPLPESAARELNDLLMQVERAMTEEKGLESRPFYKHLIYAPQPTYRKEVLPRIFEAIEAGEWEKIDGFEKELVTAFDRAAELLKKATILLDS
jgi:N-acetylated-alpha-linked acidic dipeptidase